MFWNRADGIHSENLQRIDINFRNSCKNVVGPPPGISWGALWHIIVHAWHEHVAHFVREARMCTWATMCARQLWVFASYVANFAALRWAERLLNWNPFGRVRPGSPQIFSGSKIVAFSRYSSMGCWEDEAKNVQFWMECLHDFVQFV